MSDLFPHAVSPYLEGAKCVICGQQATHKVCEECYKDDPGFHGLPLSNYVCCEHFVLIMGPAAPCAKPPDKR